MTLAWASALLSSLVAPAAAAEIVVLDLSASDGALVAGGDVGTVWEWGVVESGPGSAPAGERAWGTVLDGPYLNDAEEWVELPQLDATGLDGPALGLTHWYALNESGAGDLGVVERFDGSGWVAIEPVYGYPAAGGFLGRSGGWVTTWFALDPAVHRLRLRLSSDVALTDDGWYVSRIVLADEDPVPPKVELTSVPGDTQDLTLGYAVEARVTDNVGVESGEATWETESEGGVVPLTLDGDLATATLPVVEPGSVVSWSLTVSDGVNTGRSEVEQFEVFLAAPTALEGPAFPVAAAAVSLHWEPPDAPYPVLETRVLRDGEQVAAVSGASAEVPVRSGTQLFSVVSLFDTPLGDRLGDESEVWAVEAAVPAVTGVSPEWGYAGDHLRITVTGENLLLAQEDVTLDLGAGIAVIALDVRDVNTLVAEIFVEESASPGARDALVGSGAVQALLPSAFVVSDEEAAPRIRAVQPGALTRGEQTDVMLVLSGQPAAEDVVVYLGEGVVVDDLVVSGERVALRATVPADAPLGTYTVELDDGERIWAGPGVEVRRAPPAVQSTCAVGLSPAGGALVVVAAVAALARRRRGPDPAATSRSRR